MAEKRAAFILRRLRSLGFSKCRWLRTSLSVPSRSIFFFNRRNALSTDSPFLSLISVNCTHFLSGASEGHWRSSPELGSMRRVRVAGRRGVSNGKKGLLASNPANLPWQTILLPLVHQLTATAFVNGCTTSLGGGELKE